jgi:hypothetical protein
MYPSNDGERRVLKRERVLLDELGFEIGEQVEDRYGDLHTVVGAQSQGADRAPGIKCRRNSDGKVRRLMPQALYRVNDEHGKAQG